MSIEVEAKIGEYRQRGFMAIDDVLTAEQLQELSTFADQALHRRLATANRQSRSFGVLWTKFDYHEQEFLRQHTVFAAGWVVAAALLATRELTTGMSIFRKLPKPHSEVAWHQDAAYRDLNLKYHGVTMWVPMHAVAMESGCLEFVPGSNKTGLVEHIADPRDPTGFSLIARQPVEAERVSLPLSAGAASFHDWETLHRSGPNLSSAPRTAITIHYHAPPVTRCGSQQMWQSDVVRSNPDSNLQL